MKRIRNYSSVWRMEHVIYNFNDFTLPRHVTLSQVFWFSAFFVLSLMLKGFPPFSLTDSLLVNHVALPFALAWVAGKRGFDGKKPYSYLKSCIRFLMSPKTYTRGKPLDLSSRTYRGMCVTVGKDGGRKARREARRNLKRNRKTEGKRKKEVPDIGEDAGQ